MCIAQERQDGGMLASVVSELARKLEAAEQQLKAKEAKVLRPCAPSTPHPPLPMLSVLIAKGKMSQEPDGQHLLYPSANAPSTNPFRQCRTRQADALRPSVHLPAT